MTACLCLQAKAYMWMLLSLWQQIDTSASQANTNSAFSYKYCVLTLFYFNQKDTHSLATLLGTPTKLVVKSRHLDFFTCWRELAKVELSVRMVENIFKWLWNEHGFYKDYVTPIFWCIPLIKECSCHKVEVFSNWFLEYLSEFNVAPLPSAVIRFHLSTICSNSIMLSWQN